MGNASAVVKWGSYMDWGHWNITNNDDGMFNVKTVNETVYRRSETMKIIKVGKKKVQIQQVDRTTKNIIFQPVKCCASAKVNVLSITALFSQGSILTKDSINLLWYPLTTKRWFKTWDGYISGADIFADTGCAIFIMTQFPHYNHKDTWM